MSRYSAHQIDNSVPSGAPTFTADASIAFKVQDGEFLLVGTPSVSRLSCADPDVIQCFTTRRFVNRKLDYHDRIKQLALEEYKYFGEPGRTREGDTLRVYTNPSISPSRSCSSEIDPGACEGHMFRYEGTRAVFETTLDADGKWKENVPLEGWVLLPGEIKVSCAAIGMLSVQSLMGVYIDVYLGLGPRTSRK
jgi:hypothetical protein